MKILKRLKIESKVDETELLEYLKDNWQNKLRMDVVKPFSSLIIDKAGTLVLSYVNVDMFIVDRVFNNKSLTKDNFISIDFKPTSGKGTFYIRIKGDNSWEMGLSETPFSLNNKNIKDYANIFNAYNKLFGLSEKDIQKAWLEATTTISKNLKKNDLI